MTNYPKVSPLLLATDLDSDISSFPFLREVQQVAEEGLFPGHRPDMSQLRDSPGPKPHFCSVSRGQPSQGWVGSELGGKEDKAIWPLQIQRTKRISLFALCQTSLGFQVNN